MDERCYIENRYLESGDLSLLRWRDLNCRSSKPEEDDSKLKGSSTAYDFSHEYWSTC